MCRSDQVAVGDSIVAINNIRTDPLEHDQVIQLLQSANNPTVLELEYTLPDPGNLEIIQRNLYMF